MPEIVYRHDPQLESNAKLAVLAIEKPSDGVYPGVWPATIGVTGVPAWNGNLRWAV